MKLLRKWSRILHRDIGFLFIGTSIIYGLSGIALNHLADWNPNYSVKIKDFNTKIDLKKASITDEKVFQVIDEIDDRDNCKKYYFPQSDVIKIFLKGGSSVIVDTETGEGRAEFLKKRYVLYHANYLHYNPSYWWMWFSDIFAGSLIFLAITSLFMIRGKKGVWGRGGIYVAAGIIIPILFLIF